jgi:hypothetical protein
MSYEIKILHLDELRAAFKKAPDITAKELEKATKEAGKTILATEKEEVPIKTGQLRRSITLDYHPISVSIYPTVNYALPVHEGTKAHIILPVRASVLAFKKNGKMVFVKRVNHPGSKANKFVERTVQRTENGINNLFQRALDNIIQFLTA